MGKTGKRYPLVVLLVLLAALVLCAALAGGALAQPTFTEGTPTCVTCHASAGPGTATSGLHDFASHGFGCSTCHTVNVATPPTPGTCGGCHQGIAHIVAEPTHSTQGCSVSGCHAVADQTSKVTLKLAGLKAGAMKLGKSVTARGFVTPFHAAKVTITFQRKVGTKWTKVKAISRTSNATTGAYSAKYKPTKKGSWRAQSKVAAVTGFTKAQTTFKTFRVK